MTGLRAKFYFLKKLKSYFGYAIARPYDCLLPGAHGIPNDLENLINAADLLKRQGELMVGSTKTSARAVS